MAGQGPSLDDFIEAMVSGEAQALRLLAGSPSLVSEPCAITTALAGRLLRRSEV